MNQSVYEKLARHLDGLAPSFPPGESDVEIRLLSRLFTPEEAELTLHLALDKESAACIAGRTGLEVGKTEQQLAEMARKGLIFSIETEAGETLYHAVPWVVGIYEYQVNNLTEDFAKEIEEHSKLRAKDRRPGRFPQMRTIPIEKSLDAASEVLPYENVRELLQSREKFAVAPCICRRKFKMLGEGCDAPEEACLMFDSWADYYVRNGFGRAIDLEEVMDILSRADEANLVIQPNNAKNISFICCCCNCCCGGLRQLKKHPAPAKAVVSSFIALADPEICEGCEVCLDRCQMGTIRLEDERVHLDAARCIGCGLCVSTCPTGALTLIRKLEERKRELPEDMDDVWRIARETRQKAESETAH